MDDGSSYSDSIISPFHHIIILNFPALNKVEVLGRTKNKDYLIIPLFQSGLEEQKRRLKFGDYDVNAAYALFY